jgi:hypothetical protein
MFHGKGTFYKKGEWWLNGDFHENRPQGMVKFELEPKDYKKGDVNPYTYGKFSAVKVISSV